MELFTYYNLYECNNIKLVIKKLNRLQEEGKIEFENDREILKLTDIDLEENEIHDLNVLFDKYDIYPYPDYEDGSSYYDNYYDDDKPDY